MSFKNLSMAAISASVCMLTIVVWATPSSGETFGEKAIELGVPFIGGMHLWSPRGDVDGKVGYPLTISAPRGDCPNWTANMEIASGQLPPGLSLDSHGGIQGIPTERGHWIVMMKFANRRCNGHRYMISGASDAFVEYSEKVPGWGGWTVESAEACVEDGDGYCGLVAIRFHITGTGNVVE